MLSYQAVYWHFRKWCKDGSWEQNWISLLDKYRTILDLSSADIDGSHTPALRGGEEVAYQERNAMALILMIIYWMIHFIEKDTVLKGLMPGWTVLEPYSIGLILLPSWKSFNYIAFIVILLKKIYKRKKSK